MICSHFFSQIFRTILYVSKRTMSKDRYVWMDLEMTGLDPAKDTILEIACIITTPDLNFVSDGIALVIHQTDEALNEMLSWCMEHHGKTGLTQASRESNLNLKEAESLIAQYITKHTNEDSARYLSGNSVYMDKLFLSKYLPAVDSLLHYRLIDISTIKTLGSHWYPEICKSLPKKKNLHRALDDIKESIEELKNYKAAFFK